MTYSCGSHVQEMSIIWYRLRGKGLILSESVMPSPEGQRVSLEISLKLPDYSLMVNH